MSTGAPPPRSESGFARLLRWFVPRGFRGQVAGILLIGLALSQVMAAILYMVLLPQWQRELRPELVVDKTAMIVRLLDAVSPAERSRFARLWDEPGFRVRYLPNLDAPLPPAVGPANSDLAAQITTRLGVPPSWVQVGPAREPDGTDNQRIVVVLEGEGAAQVLARVGIAHPMGALEQVAIVAFLAFATAGLWAWLTWIVSAPLLRFARAAEQVGLDVNAPPLPETGPTQLRGAIRAFNEMQIRLQRFLNDRTRMLGAISHDLRTPLTRLRLRIETGRVAEDQTRMLADIELMEGMLSSALAFIRGLEESESADIVDLDLLLQTSCDLVSDLGGEVSYSGPGRCRYRCRPQAMMRAITNVVSNAAKYGGPTRVRLQIQREGFLIEVEDEGPGIPDSEKTKVFEPFYRSAPARDSDMQGIGLGLSIARTIILAHGGTIELRDREPHGLVVRIVLPAIAQDPESTA